MVYVLSRETIGAGNQEDMPEHAADDGDGQKRSAAIVPFAKLRLREACASAPRAEPNSEPSDEYRQQAAN